MYTTIIRYFKSLWKLTGSKVIGNRYWANQLRGIPLFLWTLALLFLILAILTWFDFGIFLGFIVITIIAWFVGLLFIKLGGIKIN